MSWNWCLAILAVLLWLINVIIFYPGYMSPDSLNQLSQAMGLSQVTDWHPPVMGLLWRLLIIVTGHTSSMLLFQTLILWAALALIALSLYRLTMSRRISVIPFGFAYLPIVINISGVIWKDVHMAVAMLLVSALLLLITAFRLSLRQKYIVVGISGLLVVYAALVRYNAALATLPLMYLLVRQIPWVSSRLRIALVMVFFVVVVGIGNIIVNTIMRPQITHPVSAIMLDDIVNVIPASSLKDTNISNRLKSTLMAAQIKCETDKISMNSFWMCMEEPGRETINITHTGELTRLWFDWMTTHPASYIGYRIQMFAMFMVVPEGTEYVWYEGIAPNQLGQTVKFERAQNILKYYILDWGYRHFSFLFQPWFWLVAGFVVFRFADKTYRYKIFIKMLALSGILYILLYIPIVVAMDFRYIYWAVMAVTFAAGLAVVDRWLMDRKRLTRDKYKET